VGLFRRRRGAAGPGVGGGRAAERAERDADRAHLEQFVASRRGVEAYVEPATKFTPMTVVLVAADGEWTRRATDPRGARDLGDSLRIPVYDVAATGYPPRMREWTSRRKAEGRSGLPGLRQEPQ
jgi:hypothetical protein